MAIEQQVDLRPRLIEVINRLYEGREVFFRFMPVVEDIMTTVVLPLTLDDKIGDALALLDEHQVRHIPILDEQRELVGIVSERDLARVLSHGVGTKLQDEADNRTLRLPLGSLGEPVSWLISRSLWTVPPGTPVLDAVRIMVDRRIDCVPVVSEEQQEPVGILTTYSVISCFQRMEVLRRASESRPEPARPSDATPGHGTVGSTARLETAMSSVADIMPHKAVVMVQTDNTLQHAVSLMQHHRIRHLPVLDAEGNLEGVLSDRDVIRYLPPTGQKPRGRGEARFRDSLFRIDTEAETVRNVLATKVGVVASSNPISVEPTTLLVKVAEIFCSHRIGFLPVMNAETAQVIGVVTQTDFLKGLLSLGRLLSQNGG
jgi:CBS domain-containing protein